MARRQQVLVRLVGGPCDGEERIQHVLPEWDTLELQLRADPLIHVYFGELDGPEPLTLTYAGCREGVQHDSSG